MDLKKKRGAAAAAAQSPTESQGSDLVQATTHKSTEPSSSGSGQPQLKTSPTSSPESASSTKALGVNPSSARDTLGSNQSPDLARSHRTVRPATSTRSSPRLAASRLAPRTATTDQADSHAEDEQRLSSDATELPLPGQTHHHQHGALNRITDSSRDLHTQPDHMEGMQTRSKRKSDSQSLDPEASANKQPRIAESGENLDSFSFDIFHFKLHELSVSPPHSSLHLFGCQE